MPWPDSPRNRPTGPGARGGQWHDQGYRNAYHRAWRAANPEYRERERLRCARSRAMKRGGDPALVMVPADARPWPVVAAPCTCQCGCKAEVVIHCGLCRAGLHEGAP